MSINLKKRHFLKELDFTPEELKYLLDLSFDLKKAKKAGTEQQKTGRSSAIEGFPNPKWNNR